LSGLKDIQMVLSSEKDWILDNEFACTVSVLCVVLHNICEIKHKNYENNLSEVDEDDNQECDEDVV
jgi:hypothetical protein